MDDEGEAFSQAIFDMEPLSVSAGLFAIRAERSLGVSPVANICLSRNSGAYIAFVIRTFQHTFVS